MREFLFHGKRRYTGEWAESVCPLGVMHSGHLCDDFIPETVGQYTGRIDKNKKRVFEGDIIRLCNGLPGFDVGVILWDDNDQAYLIVSDPVGKVILDDFGNYGRPEYYEVIGNIHDNPELIGGDSNG